MSLPAGLATAFEMSLTPNGHAPPLHVHPTHGEGFLVLSGVLSFQLGDQVITGGPEDGCSHLGMCRILWPILAIGKGGFLSSARRQALSGFSIA